jgi:hypothetical protein
MLVRQNHAAKGANGSMMVGMFVCLCFASKMPSMQEVFDTTRTDLDVKLLTNSYYMGTRRRQWMPIWQPFLTAGERFVKNRSTCRIKLMTHLIYQIIKPSLCALSQPLWMAAHASDWGDSTN